MQHPTLRPVTIGTHVYLGYREDSVQGEDHFISIADPDTREELARVIKTPAGAISLQTFGPPLPRAIAEHLFGMAELWLY